MSDSDNTNESQISEPNESQASTEQAIGSTQEPDEQFRMPMDSPQHLRGKTPEEIIEWSNTVTDGIRQMYAQQQQTQQAQSQVQAPTEALDADLILTNPEEYQKQMMERIQLQNDLRLQQAAAPLIENQADTARFMSQNDKGHADTWDRWGYDIDSKVAGLAASQRTKAVYDQAADLVRSEHIDELVNEKAQALASAGLGLDSGSNFLGDTGYSEQQEVNVWAKFEESEMGRHQLKTLGKRKIMELCDSMDMNIDDYADSVAQNRATVDPNTGAIENYDLRLGG